MKRLITVPIQGREVEITLELELTTRFYFISAVCETGFDLCTHSHGYFKDHVARNTKLRSLKSIESEQAGILDRYEALIRRDAGEFILFPTTVQGRISGDTFYGPTSVHFFDAANIHSLQSRQSISWYSHDVFNQGEIELHVERNKDGQLRFYADENALYDRVKLQALYTSERYTQRQFAFFFYEEVARLVGAPHGDLRAMSGLFAQGGSK